MTALTHRLSVYSLSDFDLNKLEKMIEIHLLLCKFRLFSVPVEFFSE